MGIRCERLKQSPRFGRAIGICMEPAELEVELCAPAQAARARERAPEPVPGRCGVLVERDRALEARASLVRGAGRKRRFAGIALHPRIARRLPERVGEPRLGFLPISGEGVRPGERGSRPRVRRVAIGRDLEDSAREIDGFVLGLVGQRQRERTERGGHLAVPQRRGRGGFGTATWRGSSTISAATPCARKPTWRSSSSVRRSNDRPNATARASSSGVPRASSCSKRDSSLRPFGDSIE